MIPINGAEAAIEAHLRRFFVDHPVSVSQWEPGPAKVQIPRVRVLEFAPGCRTNHWTYATCGASRVNDDNPFEYLMISDAPRRRYVEILTMIAFYSLHHSLGLGHIVPIGEPIISGSHMQHVYLSLPYTFGPELEIVPADGQTARILWVFPITEQERGVLRESGIDALEDQLEASGVEYWSPLRRSVV